MAKVTFEPNSSDHVFRTIEGDYLQSGIYWQSTTTTNKLLFVDRSTPSHRKPLTYILHVDGNGKRTYISSLYVTGEPDKWKIDFKGTTYHLKGNPKKSSCISIGLYSGSTGKSDSGTNPKSTNK